MEDIVYSLKNLINNYPEQIYKEKILYYIENDLTNKLTTLKNKRNLLMVEKKHIDNFINDFLINKEPYFYITNSDTYLKYDNENFKIENESNIENCILKDLAKNKVLIKKKFRIKH